MKGRELVDMSKGIHNSVVLRQDYLMSPHLVREVNAMLLMRGLELVGVCKQLCV